MIHLDAEGQRPGVLEADLFAVGPGASTDIRVDVIRRELGHADVQRAERAGEVLEGAGPLLRRPLHALLGHLSVHLLPHGLGEIEAGVGGCEGQRLRQLGVGSKQTRQRATEVVAGPILRAHGVVGLVLGAARIQAPACKHDVALVHPSRGTAAGRRHTTHRYEEEKHCCDQDNQNDYGCYEGRRCRQDGRQEAGRCDHPREDECDAGCPPLTLAQGKKPKGRKPEEGTRPDHQQHQ